MFENVSQLQLYLASSLQWFKYLNKLQANEPSTCLEEVVHLGEKVKVNIGERKVVLVIDE